jgi:hypothetical protein
MLLLWVTVRRRVNAEIRAGFQDAVYKFSMYAHHVCTVQKLMCADASDGEWEPPVILLWTFTFTTFWHLFTCRLSWII